MRLYPIKFTKIAANKVEKMFNTLSEAAQNRILRRSAAEEGKVYGLTPFERRLPESEQLNRRETKQRLANRTVLRSPYTIIKGVHDGLYKKMDYTNNLARMLRAYPELLKLPKYSKYKRGCRYVNSKYVDVLPTESLLGNRHVPEGDLNQNFKFMDIHPVHPVYSEPVHPGANAAPYEISQYKRDLDNYETYQKLRKNNTVAQCIDETSETYLNDPRHLKMPPFKGVMSSDTKMYRPITREDISSNEKLKETLARLFTFNHEVNEGVSAFKNREIPFRLKEKTDFINDKGVIETNISPEKTKHDSIDVLFDDVRLLNGHPQLNLLRKHLFLKKPYVGNSLKPNPEEDQGLRRIIAEQQRTGGMAKSLLAGPARAGQGEQRFLEKIFGLDGLNDRGALYNGKYITKKMFSKARRNASEMIEELPDKTGKPTKYYVIKSNDFE